MASGNYTHPTFLTRQHMMIATAAGANGTSSPRALPWDVNIHQLSVYVTTAGTATGNKVILLSGTTSIGQVALSTGTAGTVGTSGDLATKITAGTPISIKNGTDATGTANVVIEFNLAPDTGTWLGNE